MTQNDKAPTLQEQTIALGKILTASADEDPSGTPSETATAVFQSWLREAGPGSREPGYFEDVAAHYDVSFNSNEDLSTLFNMLQNYIEVEDEPEPEPAAPRTFIGLPLAPTGQ